MQVLLRLLPVLCIVGCLVAAAGVSAWAADAPPRAAAIRQSPLIITEVQTGKATASDEFIELYNQSDKAIDLTGWQVRYLNATATSPASTLAVAIGAYVLPAGAHFVLHTATVPIPAGTLAQTYSASLSATDKAVGLFAPDQATCTAQVQDAVAWGSSQGGEGLPVPALQGAAHRHLYRYVDGAQAYVDTASNAYDFGMASDVVPTPGAHTAALLPAGAALASGSASALAPVKLKGCSLASAVPPHAAPDAPLPPPAPAAPPLADEPETPDPQNTSPQIPARNNGLFAPQLSELLPNPAKPQTDADDEFIELYNPNTEPFELSGFVLEAGGKTKKRYTFPQGTLLPGKSFAAYYAKETRLALANTQGQVWLLDPLQRVIGQSDAYSAAKDGQAWLFAAGTWQWTTAPTPGSVNTLKAPATQKAASKSAKNQSTAQVRAARTDSPGRTPLDAQTDTAAATAREPFNPLHPGVLAVTGVIAVLYALYEYRRDLANKFYQFRRNRAARREARQSVRGR